MYGRSSVMSIAEPLTAKVALGRLRLQTPSFLGDEAPAVVGGEEALRCEVSGSATEASTGVSGRSDVQETFDRRGVFARVGEGAPEKILVELHRTAVGVAMNSVRVCGCQVGGSDHRGLEDARS